MFSVEFLVLFFGIAAALFWGAGDFSGGFASKRANVFSVVLVTQSVGVVLLPILAYVFSEKLPPINGILWGCLAGIFVSFGLIIFYTALSKEKMGIVAPVSAIIMVTVPVIYGSLNEGIPAYHQIVGFGLALIGIWFIVSMNHGPKISLNDLKLPALAGLSFGLFFVSIDNFSEAAIFWPLTVARISAIIMILGFVFFTKPVSLPGRHILPVIILSGAFNVGGTTFFALASQVGRLDIATVVSSLSTGVTVLLAWLILKETLVQKQWIGVTISLIAIILISL